MTEIINDSRSCGQHRFRVCNFGCKVNQEEGAALAALFRSLGWQEAADEEPAELFIINTCTVTQVADKKARNLIRRLSREYPQAVLAVCGCYAQRDAAGLAALAGVDIVAGVDNRRELPQLVEQYLRERRQVVAVGDISQSHQFQIISDAARQKRARAYLKIEDGCDQFCNYCVIAHVRGPVRSLPPETALAEARRLVEGGHGEIVLSGIHIGAYGSDLHDEEALPRLISDICALPGLNRLRLGSIEPQQFSEELKQVIADEPKVCRHLHIPLQAGCDKTLREMGRHYDTAYYAALLSELRERGGDIAFTGDVMVGYPGETEEDFRASLEFCRSCGFAGLHVFPYSRRQGTPAAARHDQVLQAVKARRAAELAQVSADSARAYAERYVGQKLDLLVEEHIELAGQRFIRGHSGNYLTLLLPEDGSMAMLRSVRAVMYGEDGILCEKA